MQVKKTLLREVLESNGLVDLPVYGIVVFTNNRIEAQNKYSDLKTCFLSQLPYIIDGFHGEAISGTDMALASQAITAANIEKSYPLEFDVNAFKMTFANILATLESAKETTNHNWFKTIITFFDQRAMTCAKSVATVAITILSVLGFSN